MNQLEIWEDVPEYEGLYQVSNMRRVKSLSRKLERGHYVLNTKEKFLSGFAKNKHCPNVLYVNLSKKGSQIKYSIEELYQSAFLGKDLKRNVRAPKHSFDALLVEIRKPKKVESPKEFRNRIRRLARGI